MYRLGDELAEAIGPDYDIFGFDPRGIGETLYARSTKFWDSLISFQRVVLVYNVSRVLSTVKFSRPTQF